jgi:TRAP-type transport system large permease protein
MTIIVFLVALFGAVSIGAPIAFALLFVGAALMLQLGLFDAQILAQTTLDGADSFPLLAVPFFMLAGELMNQGGLSKRIVNLALAVVGHIRGGLGYVAITAGVIMASLSGSAVADSAALASLLVPMMVKAGHDKGRSCGLVAASGIIGPIIPPSIPFVIFGVTANVSIAKLFMAGIVPGFFMGLSLAVTWWFLMKKEDVKPLPPSTRAEIMKALREGTWALVMPVIIIGGLKFGVFTPTEAAVVAAVYALFASMVVYRELKLRDLRRVFSAAARTSSVVMFLVAGSMVSQWLINVADVPGQVVSLLTPLIATPTVLLLAIMLLCMILGCLMDLTPIVLMITPVLMPLVKAAKIDPVFFGVIFIVNLSIGLITPPVGTVLNTVGGTARASMTDVVKGVWPFLIANVAVLLLMALFPALVTVPASWFNR